MANLFATDWGLCGYTILPSDSSSTRTTLQRRSIAASTKEWVVQIKLYL